MAFPRRTGALAVLVALVLGAGACGRVRGGPPDAARSGPEGVAQAQPETAPAAPPPPSAAPAPTTPAATPPAARALAADNASAVARYDDETPLGYAPTAVVRSAIAHTAPDGGRDVTLLVGGTTVLQVAERGDARLVLFPDPRDRARDEMGWIPTAAIRPPERAACRGRESTLVTAAGSFCATLCRDSSACGSDEACVGAGTTVERAGRITNLLSYCVPR